MLCVPHFAFRLCDIGEDLLNVRHFLDMFPNYTLVGWGWEGAISPSSGPKLAASPAVKNSLCIFVNLSNSPTGDKRANSAHQQPLKQGILQEKDGEFEKQLISIKVWQKKKKWEEDSLPPSHMLETTLY